MEAIREAEEEAYKRSLEEEMRRRKMRQMRVEKSLKKRASNSGLFWGWFPSSLAQVSCWPVRALMLSVLNPDLYL